MSNEPVPRLVYPPGASKAAKEAMLKEWGKQMELWRGRQAKDAGAEWMEWLSSQDGRECDHCKAMDGVKFRIGDLDMEEHMKLCTNPNGCRCVCGPVDARED